MVLPYLQQSLENGSWPGTHRTRRGKGGDALGRIYGKALDVLRELASSLWVSTLSRGSPKIIGKRRYSQLIAAEELQL